MFLFSIAVRVLLHFSFFTSSLRFLPRTNEEFKRYGSNPRIDKTNNRGQHTWYSIGFPSDFSEKPVRVTIRDVNYIVWRDPATKEYFSMRDVCSHQGASFLNAKTHSNCIRCPYHGYEFDGNDGNLKNIPFMPFLPSKLHQINSFPVLEKGNMVFLNNAVNYREEIATTDWDNDSLFVEPEFYDPMQKCVYVSEDFNHNAKFVSVNSLDICHIGFVHSFGNEKNPNPVNLSRVLRASAESEDSSSSSSVQEHFKIAYEYLAGDKSLVSQMFREDIVRVENEFILPHTTIARVIFGNFTSTIVTHALPVSKFKTRLFVKTYRNYWSYPSTNPFGILLNKIGDRITLATMARTLKEDKSIVDNIDKTNYEGMHGKFSVLFDSLSNQYKKMYKIFYEESETSL